MHAELDTMPQVKGGVTLLSRGGCVVRYLAAPLSDLTRLNKKLWDAARELVVRLPGVRSQKVLSLTKTPASLVQSARLEAGNPNDHTVCHCAAGIFSRMRHATDPDHVRRVTLS